MIVRLISGLFAVLLSSACTAYAEGFLSCREKSEATDDLELSRFFGNFLNKLAADRVAVPRVRFELSDLPATAARVENRETVVVSEELRRALLNSSEAAFVVAHELSHILLGHGKGWRTREAEVSAEFEADELALDLLRRAGHGLEGGQELLGRLDSKGKGSTLTSIRVAAMRRVAVSTRKNANT